MTVADAEVVLLGVVVPLGDCVKVSDGVPLPLPVWDRVTDGV